MKRILIYGTVYGASKKYANELAKALKIKAVDFKDVDDINNYDEIIYIGAVYAGGVIGLSKTLRKVNDYDKKKIVVATVGLSDPKVKRNVDNIQRKMKQQLQEPLFNSIKIFHLRGAIDYSKLSFLHKAMMKMVYRKALSTQEEERNQEVDEMINTYDAKVNFVDLKALKPIFKEIK